MVEITFVCGGEGSFDQSSSASHPNLFNGMLQVTEGAMSSHKQSPSELLVGYQKWKAPHLLGGMGGHDKTQTPRRTRVPGHRAI
jgi:hypothetical protein